MEISLKGDKGKQLSELLLKSYFKTQDYPFTRHHIDSFDQFIGEDIKAIVAANNPFVLLHDQIGTTGVYAHKAEIFIGGINGDQFFIGNPVVHTKDRSNIRLLFPNEARLRNLTYASTVQANIVIRITLSRPDPSGGRPISNVLTLDPVADPVKYAYLANYPLFKIPILLHSRYCILHNKPSEFLRDVGECQNDYGGYFIIGGAEKVLIGYQEAAFNTLYIREQPADPKIQFYGTISCLNPKSRKVKNVVFTYLRREKTIVVQLPFIRAPVPLFTLFRAMGVQTDADILRLIFPDPLGPEVKLLEPILYESIADGHPYYDTYSAVQYMKVLTKGFSVAHILEILHNQTFIHVGNSHGTKQAFLAECVRKFLRVIASIDAPTDRDDIRNQRVMTSGTLTRFLFQKAFLTYKKAALLEMDKEYNYSPGIYAGDNYVNMFLAGNLAKLFKQGMLTDSIMRGFKGKWGGGVGEEKTGVIQALSRLSYLDFLSHCRRIVLNFDTGMKLQPPRRLHTSQFGYFCTNETPGGASIGITKNLSMLTAISTFTDPEPFIAWLYARGSVMPCDQITADTLGIMVPVFVNSGIVGYTLRPIILRDVCKLMKWTGCLPSSASVAFSIREKQFHVYLDDGRPMRPLIHLEGGQVSKKLFELTRWRELVMGTYPGAEGRTVSSSGFIDPFASVPTTLEEYRDKLYPHRGVIEYVDPYEGNEAYVACFAENITKETTHMEVHPSTIAGLLVSMIPFANHNQSPRNQLSSSQSKQSVSVFATNYRNRFDGQTHVLCYGEAPLARPIYYDYVANGQNPYGHNLVLALGPFMGYNQEDGIVMNADALQRGLYRNMSYRSYETAEEDDLHAGIKVRVANPANIPGWTNIRSGVDYSKLDEKGIIREGEYVDENTVIVGKYLQSAGGEMRDASLTAQVWTTGRVEKIAIMADNQGLVTVKIRVIQDRTPELGDKFSNRHGQKGTLGMMIRATDMPRTASGLIPDMMMNPHAIPSRMTIAQLIESLLSKMGVQIGTITNGTMFMNDGDPTEQVRTILRDQLGMEPYGEEILYDGTTGGMIPSTMFIGNVYTMRLKHMTEDKWNARAEGRKEQRTHQPTGGRGNQGGLKIGEMDRDAIIAHGVSGFLRESMMERSDGTTFVVCNGCGTIPIYNEKDSLYICSMCDGPVKYIGETATNLEILEPTKRSLVSFSRVAIPYAVKLLDQELTTFMNIGMRYATERDLRKFRAPRFVELSDAEMKNALSSPLPMRILPELASPERLPPAPVAVEAREEDLAALGVPEEEDELEESLSPGLGVALLSSPGAAGASPAALRANAGVNLGANAGANANAGTNANAGASPAALRANAGANANAGASPSSLRSNLGANVSASPAGSRASPAETNAGDSLANITAANTLLNSRPSGAARAASPAPAPAYYAVTPAATQDEALAEDDIPPTPPTQQLVMTPMMMVPMIAAPQTQLLQPAVPGAPPTLVVDTADVSPAQRSPSRSPRANRYAAAAATPTAAAAPSGPNVKVTINKIG
jgi:DNA-directed RNA polymerase II subunit RPB2